MTKRRRERLLESVSPVLSRWGRYLWGPGWLGSWGRRSVSWFAGTPTWCNALRWSSAGSGKGRPHWAGHWSERCGSVRWADGQTARRRDEQRQAAAANQVKRNFKRPLWSPAAADGWSEGGREGFSLPKPNRWQMQTDCWRESRWKRNTFSCRTMDRRNFLVNFRRATISLWSANYRHSSAFSQEWTHTKPFYLNCTYVFIFVSVFFVDVAAAIGTQDIPAATVLCI